MNPYLPNDEVLIFLIQTGCGLKDSDIIFGMALLL